jgi:hypothetical protein
MRHLRAGGEPDRAARPRLILRKSLEDCARAADMLVLEEAIGAAADDLGDRLERRLRREALRHDRRYVAAGAGERLRQVGERPFQAEPHGAVVWRRQLVGRVHQRVGEDDTWREAADAGDHVARQYRLVVVKAQTVAQFQGPGQPVLLDGMALDHLRLRLPLRVDAVKRIEHEIGGVARRPRPGDHRVEDAEIGGPDENQGFRAVCSPPNPRRRASRKRCRRSGLQ